MRLLSPEERVQRRVRCEPSETANSAAYKRPEEYESALEIHYIQPLLFGSPHYKVYLWAQNCPLLYRLPAIATFTDARAKLSVLTVKN